MSKFIGAAATDGDDEPVIDATLGKTKSKSASDDDETYMVIHQE